MSNVLELYGSDNQPLTITLQGLVNNAIRCSAVIDNSVTLFRDIGIFLQLKAGTISGPAQIVVYAVGSVDNGANFTDGAPGTDSVFSGSIVTARQIGSFIITSSGQVVSGGPWGMAKAFDGNVPKKSAILVQNLTGGAFDPGSGNFNVRFQGYANQIV